MRGAHYAPLTAFSMRGIVMPFRHHDNAVRVKPLFLECIDSRLYFQLLQVDHGN